ncbi:MAG: hypothetical protein NTV21_04160 [Planctomycetota bacterium]|nr:hypothetical protein [Planctomycetota bacterium]
MSEQNQPAEKVRAPGMLLAIYGGLSILLGLAGIVISIIGMPLQQQLLESFAESGQELPPALAPLLNSGLLGAAGAIGIVLDIAKTALSGYVLWGGLQMMKRRNHGACMGAAIVAMLPCTGAGCCCVLGLPIGIWAIMVLNRADVRSSFGLSNSN